MAALDLLAAAAPFVGGALGGPAGAAGGSLIGGAVAPTAPAPTASSGVSGQTSQTQNISTSFGSSFAVGGSSATSGAARPATELLSMGGTPWLTIALIGAGVVGAVVLLRR